MKYKVGDKVKVREDLEEDRYYGNDIFTRLMRDYKGKVVTIEKCTDNGYMIEEDKRGWYFTDEMFEGLAKQTNIKKRLTFFERHIDEIAGTIYKYGQIHLMRNISNEELYCGKEKTLNYPYLVVDPTIHDIENIKSFLLSEVEPIKLTQFEYDLILKCYERSIKENDSDYPNKVKGWWVIYSMMDKGYFKDIDIEMTLQYILDNCEVADE